MLATIEQTIYDASLQFLARNCPGESPALNVVYIGQFYLAPKAIITSSWRCFYDMLCNDPTSHRLDLSQAWIDVLQSVRITDRPGSGWYLRAENLMLFLGVDDRDALRTLSA